MGSLLCVGQGSVRPSRVAVMVWNGAKGKKAAKPLCFVGKGVIFDTGGISIKPSEGMGGMKADMSGGAAVLGAMRAIALLKPKVNVTVLVPAVENMPSGSAARPGDIVVALVDGELTLKYLAKDKQGHYLQPANAAYPPIRAQGALEISGVMVGLVRRL